MNKRMPKQLVAVWQIIIGYLKEYYNVSFNYVIDVRIVKRNKQIEKIEKKMHFCGGSRFIICP